MLSGRFELQHTGSLIFAMISGSLVAACGIFQLGHVESSSLTRDGMQTLALGAGVWPLDHQEVLHTPSFICLILKKLSKLGLAHLILPLMAELSLPSLAFQLTPPELNLELFSVICNPQIPTGSLCFPNSYPSLPSPQPLPPCLPSFNHYHESSWAPPDTGTQLRLLVAKIIVKETLELFTHHFHLQQVTQVPLSLSPPNST